MTESPVAIVTGAGSGIGRAAAIELARSGWRCALVGRRRDRLEETASLIPNVPSLIINADLSEVNASNEVVRRIVREWGHTVAAVVNNAATLIAGPVHLASDEDVLRTFEINAFAPLRLVRAAWPHLSSAMQMTNMPGRVINVSSAATIDPFPGLGVYGMSKAALEGLTRAINKEGPQQGIIGFSIVLGAVETEMLRSFIPERSLPRSRTKDPAEIGRVIAECVRGERDAECRSAIVVR